MFQQEQQIVDNHIRSFCVENDIPVSEMKWSPIPFSGEWGISTSFFQTAANEAKAGKGNKTPIPQRAQQIAEQMLGRVDKLPGISHAEAVKGYLNLYFDTSTYAGRVVDAVM